ncbi:hypothetical protein [Devosia chinhatensis]|uniref:Uncharacterized protein n=1 Tax=Devosia chinhatensis TaxID=429727 RepID=A0A0F5FM41_9HYPH|nr:hypothetical protein [Devosia chinhatensis]KKB09610.1 hypothetical protein VE26_06945 [Devosia chinhatensis]
MSRLTIAAIALLSVSAPTHAHSSESWQPCISGEPTFEGIIGAFQAEGWAFPTSNEDHVDNLKAVAEPILAMQRLPDVTTGSGYDRHIDAVHERAEALLMDAATLQRDDLVVSIESAAGGMIRCAIAGNDFDEVAHAFEGGDADIQTVMGHEILSVDSDADVTLYRVVAPEDATAVGLAAFAVIVIRQMR